MDETALAGGMTLPQNLEAEMCVLGSVLIDSETIHDVVLLLVPVDFYLEAHRTIYKAIVDLFDLGQTVDAITLAMELSKRGEFEEVGGDEAIRKILEAPPHAANAKYYAQIVRQRSISRRVARKREANARFS
jgi:replicative DNA helicase